MLNNTKNNKRVVTVIMAAFLVVFLAGAGKVSAAASSFKLVKCNIPTHQYVGKGFWVKGTVKSNAKLTKVRCGILNSKSRWMNKMNYIASTNKYSFDVEYFDSKIIFGKLAPGTYYYRIWAKDVNGNSKTLVNRKFTVSKLYVTNKTVPGSTHTKGKAFSLRGIVKSKFAMRKVTVGITNNAGTWKKGFYVSKNINSTTFNIKNVDSKIKFGKLGNGTYRYKVFAKDKFGKYCYVINKKFTIGKAAAKQSGQVKLGGYRLKYKANVINAIGKQPVSGPCGQYAMAYCRAIIDGSFPKKKKYASYYKQLYWEYGLGSHWAYWYKADGSPVWYSSAKSCYKAALKEVSKGNPCVINLHNKNTGNNHFVTVIGYTPGTTLSNVRLKDFIVLDPGNGKLQYIKYTNYTDSKNPECVFF